MGLFAPWFLGGLLAAGLPLWVHLLRQHRSVPRPFASLMFFERRTQSSIKHRRLKHYVLLAFRLAIIVLLVLLFANPFIRRAATAGTGRKLVLVAVDNSFSMRYGDHLTRARAEAMSVLSQISGRDLAQVAAVSDRVELLTQATHDRNTLRAAVGSLQPGDATSSYAEFARFLRALPKSANMPVEAHFISDVQRSAMPASFGDLGLGDRVALRIHPVVERSPSNWVVEGATAPERIFQAKKARVVATVAWKGPDGVAPAARTTAVTLLINGRAVETRQVSVTGRASVEFQNVDMPYGANRGEVRVDAADPLPQDNRYLFSIERADAAKVLFIHDSRQPAEYFRAALEAGGDAAFEVDAITPDVAANVNLARYAYVALAGVAGVPQTLETNLRNYVSRGGGLLIALSPVAAARGRVPVTDSRILETRYSAPEGERFQTAASVETTHPALQGAGGFDGVKFYWAARLDAAQDRVLAKLSDGTALLLERHIGEGRVLTLASGFDNVSNDLPLHAGFVAFVERLSQYLEGGETRQANVTVGAAIELRKNADRGAAADVLGPGGQRLLSLKDAATALTITAAQEGFYDVRTASGRRELIAVNADRRESDLTPIPDETLALWRGTGGTAPAQAASGANPEEVPQSLWKYILIALLVTSAAESWLADRFTPASRDERVEMKRQAA